MDRTILQQLQKLGLSKKEAALYLSLLGLGKADVQEIAEAASVNRSTTYVLLDELTSKGFAEEVPGMESRAYYALPPKELVRRADSSVVAMEKAYMEIGSAIEDLDAIAATYRGIPRTVFFENKEGLKALRQEVQRAAGSDKMSACIHALKGNEYVLESPNIRTIANADANLADKVSLGVLRFVSSKDYPFTSDFFLFRNIIVLISDSENFAVRIESKEFAEVTGATFDLAWGEAEHLDAKIRKSNKKPSSKR